MIPTNVTQVIAIWISLPFPFSHPKTDNVSVILSWLYDIIHVYLLPGKYSSDNILTYPLRFKSNFTSSVKIFLTSGQFVLCALTDVLMTLLIGLFCLFIPKSKSCQIFATPCTTACQASLFFIISQSLLKLMSHWVGDAIQPSHPLSPPSPPALNLSQHQGLFQWVDSLYYVANVLALQPQHQSFQWVFRVEFLKYWLVKISLLPKGLSSVFSSTIVWKHQFFGAQPSLLSNSHTPTWLLEKS